MTEYIDLTGQRFEKLVVIERVENDRKGSARWKCKCDCGKETIVIGWQLRNGNTRSCGCLQRKSVSDRNYKHGLAHTHPLYNTWTSMKRRCYVKKCKDYSNYGGRGIIVCNEWEHDFTAFYDWALANGWNNNLSIDRIDNDGNYCPENCRWADINTQSNNRSTNIWIEYNGEKHTVGQWGKILGFKDHVLRDRLFRLNWSVEKAFTTPVRKMCVHL